MSQNSKNQNAGSNSRLHLDLGAPGWTTCHSISKNQTWTWVNNMSTCHRIMNSKNQNQNAGSTSRLHLDLGAPGLYSQRIKIQRIKSIHSFSAFIHTDSQHSNSQQELQPYRTRVQDHGPWHSAIHTETGPGVQDQAFTDSNTNSQTAVTAQKQELQDQWQNQQPVNLMPQSSQTSSSNITI